jgi:hypothetical protein
LVYENLCKNRYPFAVTGLISTRLSAQKTIGIPQAVITAFSAKYPQAQVKKWKTNKTNYVAIFKLENEKYAAYWSKDGNWLKTENNINRPALPVEVQAYLKKGEYASWHIDDMKKVLTPDQNTYQLHIDNHSGSPLRYEDANTADDKLLSFDTNGKLIKVANY